MGADRGRDRRRRQRLDERPARRPRRPHAADRQRHGPRERRHRRRLRGRAHGQRRRRLRLRRRAGRVAGQALRRRHLQRRRNRHERAVRRARGTQRARRTARPTIRALITDAAGNVRTTAVIPVTVDSTGPSVTLTDPGAVVSGTVALTATHRRRRRPRRLRSLARRCRHLDGDRLRHERAVRHARSTRSTVADGLYDLRAIGYDSLGNPSSPSVRANVRFDNIAPTLVSSAPADGSVSTSANQIVLTASEPVTAPGALSSTALAAPAPVGVRLDADLRDRRADRRPARALGRARGRERHAHRVPRRGHDREHAVEPIRRRSSAASPRPATGR